MTLAVLFLLGIFCTSPNASGAGGVSQSTPSTASAQEPAKQQDANQPQTPPDSKQAAPSQTPAEKPKPTTKHPRSRKKKNAGCNPAPATASPSTGANQAPTAGDNSSGKISQSAQAPDNCPPPKIVIRQGGTAEPSIQLAGGPEANKATERATANQMLDAMEANLKKLGERQLSAPQQDTVTQIRQFMEQSKTAEAAGDADRAQKLAWKAKTLSDDLVNPQQ